MSAAPRFRRAATLTVPEAARVAVRELLRVAPLTDTLAARFRAGGHQLFLVGGSVRDALLGRLGGDLDFTTDARPEETLRLVRTLGATWTTGMDFGTVGVAVGTGDQAHRRSPPSAAIGTTRRAASPRWRSDPRSTETCPGATSP